LAVGGKGVFMSNKTIANLVWVLFMAFMLLVTGSVLVALNGEITMAKTIFQFAIAFGVIGGVLSLIKKKS
jgi:hypothetical protein